MGRDTGVLSVKRFCAETSYWMPVSSDIFVLDMTLWTGAVGSGCYADGFGIGSVGF
ncbi:hypothetical protein AVEN_257478-1, partial [Araneus ventricosus]